MYERNAIVLERYFDKAFFFSEKNNLKENYLNYRKLLECYEQYTQTSEAEKVASEEFKQVCDEISRIQKTQEKLYKKDAKYEYSRNIVFNNIEEKPEEIKKYLTKIESEIAKVAEEVKSLGQEFVTRVIEYNEKKSILENCKQDNRNAKKEFELILKKAKEVSENLSEENINFAKEFVDSENKELRKELTNTIEANGKSEKNQFDPDVIANAVDFSIDVYKIEIDIYLNGIERIKKLLSEIEAKDVKLDKHKKFYNDTKLKLDFMQAKKEYLVQFLDNERIAAIYDKKMHRKLMLEACRNLIADLGQINKLYDIILKECLGRSTKRLYKENYNKQYLFEMEKNALDTNLNSNKIKTGSVAVMNLNYWRIEGIKRIYEAFDEDVTKIYGRDLSEFNSNNEDAGETEEVIKIDTIQAIVPEKLEKVVKKPKLKIKGVANPKQENHKVEQKENIEESIEEAKTEQVEDTSKEVLEEELVQALPTIKTVYLGRDDYGLFTSTKQAFTRAVYLSIKLEKARKARKPKKETYYFDVDAKMAELDLLDEDEPVEKSLIDAYFNEQNKYDKKRKAKDNQKLDEDIERLKKGNILKKIININSKTKKEA